MYTPDKPLDDKSPMPFGKYIGKTMANVPAKYLLYLYDQCCDHPGVKQYTIENLEGLKKEAGIK